LIARGIGPVKNCAATDVNTRKRLEHDHGIWALIDANRQSKGDCCGTDAVFLSTSADQRRIRVSKQDVLQHVAGERSAKLQRALLAGWWFRLAKEWATLIGQCLWCRQSLRNLGWPMMSALRSSVLLVWQARTAAPTAAVMPKKDWMTLLYVN
jgi:hypothetical protein